jgi:PPOX class F420-dependent enzyme/OxyR family protein
MSVFTDAERRYLTSERLLGRLATVGADGMPHVAPVGWSLAEDATIIEVTGHNFAATKKFRDVARSGRAAIVIDDVLPPWRPGASRSAAAPRRSMGIGLASGFAPSASSPGESTPSPAEQHAPSRTRRD